VGGQVDSRLDFMMQCERCHIRPASVHVQDQTRGPDRVMNLCVVCATRSLGEGLAGPQVAALIGNLVARLNPSLGTPAGEGPAAAETPARSCSRCGLTAGEFIHLGRLGCPDCYEALAAEVGPVLRSRHRGPEHTGGRPRQASESTPVQDTSEREVLRLELEQAVAEEAFERAAEIRDALRRLH